jgi:hypothetical protein
MSTRILLRSATALLICGSLSSCALITAPLKLLGRAANGLLSPIGGLGGAASLAPLLLDAEDGSQKPVRGLDVKLIDKAPSQRVEQDRSVATAQQRRSTNTISE